MGTLMVNSLRGGQNDSDPSSELPDDQVTLARNVEFFESTCGERRNGALEIDLTGSDLASCDRVVWLHRHLPTSNVVDAQLWAMGITGSTAVLAYKDITWHTVTMPDAPIVDGVSEYQVEGITLHNKLFIAYKSAVDRLHVWDGTNLRRVGMVQPSAAPTGANSGSGSFATTRYYRTRETVQSGGSTILRSEPSDTLTFAPTGSGSGVTVTKPATTNSDPAATHWELEASLDNSNFYIIATTAIGTTTATDTTSAAAGYGTFVLSEDIGDYEVPHSAKHLLADEDRLIIAGSWEDEELASAVSWTPVFNATGVGNDERITLDPVSNVNLDGSEGGPITDAGRWGAGELGFFKEGHCYKLLRTGNRQRAYEAFAESKVVGALPGSVVEGVDQAGNAALYFLDPAVGPYRYMLTTGLQYCGHDVWETWQTVNVDATAVKARGFYYRTKKQVHWRIPTDDSSIPTLGLVLQTNETRTGDGGDSRRGFSTWTGPSCAALAACLYSINIDFGTDRSVDLVPLIGVEGDGLIWRCDTADDDNGTEYIARITTKPLSPTALQTQFEVKSATLVGKTANTAKVVVSAIPDFGTSTIKIADDVDFSPEGDETDATRRIDDIGIAELTVVQMDFSDAETPGARWELARFALTVSTGQGN